MVQGPDREREPPPPGSTGPAGVGDDLDRRLAALKQRVGEKSKELEGADARGANPTSWTVAFRYGTEFAGGVLVGAIIGVVIDHFAGTSPWGMIFFLLMGFAAGVLNVIRAANSVGAAVGKPADKDKN